MGAWVPWLYHYGVGGFVFVTVVIIALRAGALRSGHRLERRLLVALCLGLVAFMAVHGVWIALVNR